MKSRTLIVIWCVAWMVLTNHVLAAIRPTFSVGCAWYASDIVVVTQGESANGILTVQETWHGQLVKGDQIHVAGLPQTPISVSTRYDGMFGLESPAKANEVGGERIVLFLKPLEIKPDAEITFTQDIKRFQGASPWEETYASAVWFEQDQAYAFQQFVNPGPSELHPYGGSEEDLKKSVMAILADKDSLEKAKSLEQPTDRVAALLPLTKDAYGQASRESLIALGKCGKPALPVLKEMIGNDAYDQHNVVDAIAEASGADAGREITAILEKELAFWKTKGPELAVGWWNDTGGLLNTESWERLNKLRSRYGILHGGLWALEKQPYPPSRELVTQIRDFWISLPQLDDKSGLNQISQICEQILEVLDQKSCQ